MRSIDMTNVQEAGNFQRPGAGAYICTITKVQDVPLNADTGKGDYLKIWYDIAEGEFKGYYSKMREDHPDWAWSGVYCRSYKEKALGMFKRFCSAISKSNGNFIFDGNTVNSDEKTLAGKKVGIVLQEEEYYGNDGEKRTRLIVQKEFPVSEIAIQKVPKKKELKEETTAAGTPEGIPDEIPF